ncbi:hypothetical protein A3L04_03320 [Thermococcus chitonophagus]|uniref:Uncharacterized protein n=1 Tax=Thermococcus chitonophagus TaxID=54262 RepID=A0A161KJB5_9EURY|nr:hypothetical protein [Thermococcus chitonophagus]ASJ16177.1 hypothetical protein A3L04_03320 [Thermococcus chitonophagus]CUX78854.1 hypothetical protein CHITON_2075 [Thermococcus chitonophagus]
MKPLQLASYLLALNAVLIFVMYQGSGLYQAFGLLSLLLAVGVRSEVKIAIKTALIYAGAEFFFALLYLMVGNLLSAIDAGINLLIIHDILTYVQEKYGKS